MTTPTDQISKGSSSELVLVPSKSNPNVKRWMRLDEAISQGLAKQGDRTVRPGQARVGGGGQTRRATADEYVEQRQAYNAPPGQTGGQPQRPQFSPEVEAAYEKQEAERQAQAQQADNQKWASGKALAQQATATKQAAQAKQPTTEHDEAAYASVGNGSKGMALVPGAGDPSSKQWAPMGSMAAIGKRVSGHRDNSIEKPHAGGGGYPVPDVAKIIGKNHFDELSAWAPRNQLQEHGLPPGAQPDMNEILHQASMVLNGETGTTHGGQGDDKAFAGWSDHHIWNKTGKTAAHRHFETSVSGPRTGTINSLHNEVSPGAAAALYHLNSAVKQGWTYAKSLRYEPEADALSKMLLAAGPISAASGEVRQRRRAREDSMEAAKVEGRERARAAAAMVASGGQVHHPALWAPSHSGREGLVLQSSASNPAVKRWVRPGVADKLRSMVGRGPAAPKTVEQHLGPEYHARLSSWAQSKGLSLQQAGAIQAGAEPPWKMGGYKSAHDAFNNELAVHERHALHEAHRFYSGEETRKSDPGVGPRGYPAGTIRTWGGEQYVKRADKKWTRHDGTDPAPPAVSPEARKRYLAALGERNVGVSHHTKMAAQAAHADDDGHRLHTHTLAAEAEQASYNNVPRNGSGAHSAFTEITGRIGKVPAEHHAKLQGLLDDAVSDFHTDRELTAETRDALQSIPGMEAPQGRMPDPDNDWPGRSAVKSMYKSAREKGLGPHGYPTGTIRDWPGVGRAQKQADGKWRVLPKQGQLGLFGDSGRGSHGQTTAEPGAVVDVDEGKVDAPKEEFGGDQEAGKKPPAGNAYKRLQDRFGKLPYTSPAFLAAGYAEKIERSLKAARPYKGQPSAVSKKVIAAANAFAAEIEEKMADERRQHADKAAAHREISDSLNRMRRGGDADEPRTLIGTHTGTGALTPADREHYLDIHSVIRRERAAGEDQARRERDAASGKKSTDDRIVAELGKQGDKKFKWSTYGIHVPSGAQHIPEVSDEAWERQANAITHDDDRHLSWNEVHDDVKDEDGSSEVRTHHMLIRPSGSNVYASYTTTDVGKKTVHRLEDRGGFDNLTRFPDHASAVSALREAYTRAQADKPGATKGRNKR